MDYKDKRILVTGHSGFKGRWLTLWLRILGAKVEGYSLPQDIRNHRTVAMKMRDRDLVIHMAAQSLVRESYKKPRYTIEVNLMGTVNVLEGCKDTPLLVITSDKCYQNSGWRLTEGYPMGGNDPYSASKGCAELVVSAYRKSFDMMVATARAGNVIGGGDWNKDRLIPDLIKGNAKIRNPKSVRPWQHVLDCLYGYLLLGDKLMNKKKKYATAWNFGPDETMTVEDVIKLTGIDYKMDNKHNPPEEKVLILNSDKARDELKWQPKYSIEEAVDKTMEWYREYKHGRDITLEQIKDY